MLILCFVKFYYFTPKISTVPLKRIEWIDTSWICLAGYLLHIVISYYYILLPEKKLSNDLILAFTILLECFYLTIDMISKLYSLSFSLGEILNLFMLLCPYLHVDVSTHLDVLL